jgi:hypothetical protein
MSNISATGLVVTIIASNSFPVAPIVLNDWADDADPFDFENLTIAADAMGLNGDYLTWSSPTPLRPTLNVIPGSESDKKLGLLFELNRVGEDKTGAGDVITMTGQYPGHLPIVLSGGAILNGSPASSAASSGRIKSKAYQFGFGNKVGGIG